MDSVDRGPTDPLITRVHEYHRKAYSLISSALTLDENRANLAEALKLYKDGLAEIQRCCAIDLSYGKGPKYDRARGLQEKLMKNYADTKDRVVKLEGIMSVKERATEEVGELKIMHFTDQDGASVICNRRFGLFDGRMPGWRETLALLV